MAYKARFDEDRGFGVEIEVCGSAVYGLTATTIEWFLFINNKWNHQWQVIQDASIQGLTPFEVISPILYGKEGLTEVIEVMKFLNKIECKVNNSCGFHVHWDASDFSGNNLLSLLKFYTKFEWVIDGLVNENRRYNNCRHAQSLWKEADLDWIDQLGEDKLAVSVASNFQEFYPLNNTDTIPSARHHKVNICSLLKYGTVEFRQHHGTLYWQEAVDWIVLTQLMMNKAKESKIDNSIYNCTLSKFLRSLGVKTVSIDLEKRLKERYKC